MDFDLIIFDCDGVLVDSEPIGNRLIADALTEAGLPISADNALDQFLGGKLTLIKEEVEKKLNKTLSENWVENIYEKQFAEFRKKLLKIPGIDEVLDFIESTGTPICVGSNGPPNKMEVSLGVTGLIDKFRGRIFSADHVGAAKPAPDLYLFCARQMGVIPSRCLVIEDSPRGAMAGVSAGMTVYGYAGGTDADKLTEAGCSAVFENMKDLIGLL